jgi:hypothetical protein
VLPAEIPEGTNNLAQLWCAGYAEGIAGCQDEWKPFFDDETAAMLFMPIMALGAPDLWEGEAIPEVELLVTALPAAAVAIATYWRDPSGRRAPKRASRTGPPATPAATSVHRLKIQLADVKPVIWRRVEIPSDAKLPEVSRILLAAMGWTDSHLHAFRVGDITYGVRDPDFPDDMRSERSVTLAQIAPQPKSRFLFDYDFGDGWEHRVTVEAIVDAKDADAPRCVAGARACPPEDCGGPYGYANLLDVLADPQHEGHEEMRAWVGDEFDPTVFDLRRANEEIRALKRRGWRASP